MEPVLGLARRIRCNGTTSCFHLIGGALAWLPGHWVIPPRSLTGVRRRAVLGNSYSDACINGPPTPRGVPEVHLLIRLVLTVVAVNRYTTARKPSPPLDPPARPRTSKTLRKTRPSRTARRAPPGIWMGLWWKDLDLHADPGSLRARRTLDPHRLVFNPPRNVRRRRSAALHREAKAAFFAQREMLGPEDFKKGGRVLVFPSGGPGCRRTT
jgi:hypothetical protein